MVSTFLKITVLSLAMLSVCAFAQETPAAAVGLSGCGDPTAKFEVKTDNGAYRAQPDTGKALVYFIEEDVNTNIIVHTSRAGIDGKWMGATHGNSYFSFSVDPGIHHLCATTQVGDSSNNVLTSVAHFTAEAGRVYYFEMKNLSLKDSSGFYSVDVTLLPLDSDEGEYLTSRLPFATSRQKK